MASEPLWCDVRQHYCRCHDHGKRCEDYADDPIKVRGVMYRDEDDAYDAMVQREIDGD